MSTLQRLADDLQLTLSAAAATHTAKVDGYDQHTLFILYSPDTDSTNALQVTIELSPDGTNWFPYTGQYSASTGTATPGTAVTLSFDSASTADQFHPPYFFNGAAKEIRIKAVETNTPGDYGNYTAWLFSNKS